jgi:hypothetical protein
MDAVPEALNCPNCGAPLPRQTAADFWLCVYCASVSRVDGGVSQTRSAPQVAAQLVPQALDEVKALLTSGERSEAEERYQEIAGVDAVQAQQALDQMADAFSIAALLRSRLSPFGMFLVVSNVLLLVLVVVAWTVDRMPALWALGLGGFALFELSVFGRGAITTARYWGAPRAEAEVQHFTFIGKTRRGKQEFYTCLFVLEVRPKDSPVFQAKTVIPVRAANRTRVGKGELLEVRYFPGKPESVVFERVLKYAG